jgi:hypothetical protein
MIFARLNKALCCSTLLALLALRVIMPVGYMPASAGSGLLFELCPEGLPVAVMNAISGGEHHHHHGGGERSKPGSMDEQCPIGHMLSSLIASGELDILQWLPAPESFYIDSVQSLRRAMRTPYLSRGPPL